jgi:hypothetical protein
MNSAIVEEGSVASGDGHQGYAARRRNLACRPLALGRPTAHMKACRLNGDYQPAETTTAQSQTSTINYSSRTNRGRHLGRWRLTINHLD